MNASSRSPASARFPYPAPAPSRPDEPGRKAHPQGGSAYLKVTGSEPVSPWESIRSPHPKRPSHRSRRDPRPIEAIDQHGELRGGEANNPALDRRPGEAPLFEPLGGQDQTGAVKGQDLHPIGRLRVIVHLSCQIPGSLSVLTSCKALKFFGRRAITSRTPICTVSVASAATGTCQGAEGMICWAGSTPWRISR